jgi:hypothetical protein
MLDAKGQRLVKRYKHVLRLPRWKYILLYGVIGWGITVAILVLLFDAITEWKLPKWNEVFSAFLFYPAGGILMGLFMRWWAARQLNKLEEKQNTA